MSTRSTILLLASAAFVAGFVLWRSSSTAIPATETRISGDSPPISEPAVTRGDLSAPESVGNLKAPASPADTTADASAKRESPKPDSGPPPLSDLSSVSSLESAQFDPIPPADREFFAAKYAQTGVDGRRHAREILEALFNAHKSGEESKSNAMSTEEAAALEREILWLVENPGT